MPFELNSKQLFLTWAQFDRPIQECYDYLWNKLEPVELIVAHELHKNGDFHRHAYVKLATPLHIRRADYFDDIGKHGNYQGCRSPKAVLKYCTKNEDYLSNIDVGDILDAVKNHRKKGLKALVEGTKRPRDLVLEDSALLNGYKKLKGDFMAFEVDNRPRRMCKIEALWYWGDTRLGKTWKSLIDAGVDVHGDMKEVYFKDISKWFDGYEGEPIVLMDEVPKDCDWLLNFLKRWTDSLPELIQVKNGYSYKQWSKFIITSQHSIRDVFGKLDDPSRDRDIDALYERFTEVFISTKQY